MGIPDRVIADILGHQSVSTTQKHYIRAEGGHLVEALDKAAALMLPGRDTHGKSIPPQGVAHPK